MKFLSKVSDIALLWGYSIPMIGVTLFLFTFYDTLDRYGYAEIVIVIDVILLLGLLVVCHYIADRMLKEHYKRIDQEADEMEL